MNEVQIFEKLKYKEIDGHLLFDAEDAARMIGLVKTSKGNTYVRWERVNEYALSTFGQPEIKRGDFITEQQVYKIAIKANSQQAEKFQEWLTTEVLPAIRKNGGYQMQSQIRLPQNFQEMTMVTQNMVKEQTERVQKVERDLTELKNDFGLPSKVAGDVKNLGGSKVIYWLNGKTSNAYKTISKTVFSEFWKDFKDHFGGLSSYKDLPLEQLKEGKEYINNWQPSTNTMLKIRELNAQTELDMEE